MGTNSLTTEIDGELASADAVNQFKTALANDLLPRNSTGVVQDIIGSIGSSVARWLNGYFEKLVIGAISSGLSIEEDSGDLIFKVDDTIRARISSSGITPSSVGLGRNITSVVTHTVPLGGFTDIPGFSTSITTKGGPVFCTLVSKENPGTGEVSSVGNSTGTYDIQLVRGASTVCGMNRLREGGAPGIVALYDHPSAGTYTYKLQGAAAGTTYEIQRCRMLIMELF